MSYLRAEAGQEPLGAPLAVPLLRRAELRRVLLQEGGRQRGLLAQLGGHRSQEAPLVVLHLWNTHRSEVRGKQQGQEASGCGEALLGSEDPPQKCS